MTWFTYHSVRQHALVPLWSRVPERIRWRIVDRLNHSRHYCWVDLVDAALSPKDGADACDGWLPIPTNRAEQCRTVCGWGAEHDDHRECTCYCGKFKVEPGARHVRQAAS